MADPRDYIMQGAAGLSAGIEGIKARDREEAYLNTALPEPAQVAFNRMLPQPLPVKSYGEDVGAAAGGLGGLAAGNNPMKQPSQAAVGMEHPEIKAMAEKVARGEIDPKLAAQQMRRFTNRDVPGLKLSLEAREQESRMRQAESRGEGLTFEQRLLLERERGDQGVRKADTTGGYRVQAAEAGAGASNYRADRGLEGKKYGADQSRKASDYRADRAYDAAARRAQATESSAHTRFGTKNTYINDVLKNLKIKADAVGKAGSQLDLLRNLKANGGGVDPDQMKKRQSEYDAAVREYNAYQKFADDKLKEAQQPEQSGSSTSTERGSSTARAGAAASYPWAIRQPPGSPPPSGMENATPVQGRPPPTLPTRTEGQEPPAAMNAPFMGRNEQPVRAIPRPPMGQPAPQSQQFQSNGQPTNFSPPPGPDLSGVGDVVTRVAYSAKTNTTYFFSGSKVVKTVPGKVQ